MNAGLRVHSVKSPHRWSPSTRVAEGLWRGCKPAPQQPPPQLSPRTAISYAGGEVQQHSRHRDGSKRLLRQKGLELVLALSQGYLSCPEGFF